MKFLKGLVTYLGWIALFSLEITLAIGLCMIPSLAFMYFGGDPSIRALATILFTGPILIGWLICFSYAMYLWLKTTNSAEDDLSLRAEIAGAKQMARQMNPLRVLRVAFHDVPVVIWKLSRLVWRRTFRKITPNSQPHSTPTRP